MFGQEQLQDLRRTIGAWVTENCGPEDLEQAERMVDLIAQTAGAAAAEAMLPRLAGRERGPGGPVSCSCGRRAKFVGYRSRGIGTLYGVVEVERAYFYCKHCHQGYIPWDAQQGLNERLWTPRVKALVAQMGAQLPFQQSVDVLQETLGFKIEDSSADELMREVGGRLRTTQDGLMAEIESGEIVPFVARAPQRLYVSMDGTSAHTGGSWHEVKTGAVYEGRPDKDGKDCAHATRYVAAQEAAQSFGSRLYMAAAQAGVQVARETVVIGDGAEWIWNLADHHYLGATQIVDVWHACEHIHALARVCYGEGDEGGKRWAQRHCRGLKEKGPRTLLRALKRMQSKDGEQREAIRREIGYFERNAARMAYPRFRRQGMMIGSGPVEAACKVVVGQRLKQAGMRWSEAGADAVLATRAALLSGQQGLIHQAAKAA
jgi:hypothetical protein